MKVNKTILRHKVYIIDEMLKDNKNIEDILIQCNFTKKQLIESGLNESSKIAEELILEVTKDHKNNDAIGKILDRLDDAIDMKL